MSIQFESAPLPDTGYQLDDLDEKPPVESPGIDPEAPYGYTATGRIRKRPVGSKRATGSTTPIRAEKLATQATAIIMQGNGYLVLGAMVSGMSETASKLEAREKTFEVSVYNALVLDPALSARILKAGVKSGGFMLLIAVLSHAVAVLPTAVTEYRELRQVA